MNRKRITLKTRCFTITVGLLLSVFGVSKAVKAFWGDNSVHAKTHSSISIEVVPIADFSFSPTGSCADVPIQFTDNSTGADLTYLWDFGDGQTSTVKNPVHRFSTATGTDTQTFEVTLTVTNELDESHSVTKDVEMREIPSLKIGSDREYVLFDNKPFFVVCGNAGADFTFYNQSSTTDTNTSYTIDWGDEFTPFEGTAWTALTHNFEVGITSVTYTVTGPSCTVTENFYVFVGSNPAVGLGNPGNTNVCSGESLTFPVSNTESNPPGTTYRITFSDGSEPQMFNHPPPAEITHTFDLSSCGFHVGSFPNSFSATIEALNPCARSEASVVPIYVSDIPEPIISIPSDPVCTETPVELENISTYQNEIGVGGNCIGEGKFIWEITPSTGWELENGSLGVMTDADNSNSWTSGSRTLTPVFTEPGTYEVKLTNGTRCGNGEVIETICILPEPVPSFEMDIMEGCGPVEVKATNYSNVLEACGSKLFNWTVSYAGGDCGTTEDWEFAEGFDSQSENPAFIFNNPGEYTIALNYPLSCGTFTEEKTILITGPPVVDILGLSDLCEPGSITPTSNVSSCGSEETIYEWTFEGGLPATFQGEVPGEVFFETPGEKAITLKVTNNCGITEITKTMVVYALQEIDLGPSQEICLGESATLSPTLTHDEGNFSYAWTSVPNSAIPNATSREITVAPKQNTVYKLSVTNMDSNCSVEDEMEVKVLPAPEIVFSLPDQIICSGETTVPVMLSTDLPGNDIAWNAESPAISGLESTGTDQIPAQTLVNNTNLPVEVQFIASITSSELGSCSFVPVVYTVMVLPIPAITDQTLEICNGEEVTFTASPPETVFQWSIVDAMGVQGATPNAGEFRPFVQSLENPGTTPLTITYELVPKLAECEGDPFIVSVTVLPSPNINFSLPDQVICSDQDTEQVTLTSDVPDVHFTWWAESNAVMGVVDSGEGNTIPAQYLINPTESPIEVIYEVFAETDTETACSGIPQTYRITVNPRISVEDEIKQYSDYQVSCAGSADGAISIEPRGGSGNYVINWTGPDGFQSSSTELTGLNPGTYNLFINDEYGCSFEKTYILSEPEPLSAALVHTTDITCKGEATGNITIEAKGGVETPGYTYHWTRNGVLISDNSPNLSNLPAGLYEVMVMDANNCQYIIEGIQLTEPEEPLILAVDKGDISCYNENDGYINIDVTGGVMPYAIHWDFGSSATGFDNLGPGIYTVTVTDALGCEVIRPIAIEDAPIFEMEPEISQISCFDENDGSIKLNLKGQDGNISIRWDHGPEVENIFNLAAGAYGVTLTNADGCEIRREFNIVEPALLRMEPIVTDALDCNDSQSGSIITNVSGGSPPYSFIWSNGQTTENLSGVTTGNYSVVITDASGCSIEELFEIKRPSPLEIKYIREVFTQCEPRSITEEITISISGGVADYEIEWSGGVISTDGRTMTTNQSGFYSVTVTDGNGCWTRESFDVQNTEVLADTEISSVTFQQDQGFLAYRPIEFENRSTGPITNYFWDFGDGNTSFEENPTHTYKAAGTYEVLFIVTDQYNCTTEKIQLVHISDYFIAIPNVFTPNDDGLNDFFFPKFINIQSIEFWIMNKWGETIFHTDDLESEGWDGTVQGKTGIAGNYVYKLKYETIDGRTETKTGVFLMLK